jgi:hypothetical protein
MKLMLTGEIRSTRRELPKNTTYHTHAAADCSSGLTDETLASNYRNYDVIFFCSTGSEVSSLEMKRPKPVAGRSLPPKHVSVELMALYLHISVSPWHDPSNKGNSTFIDTLWDRLRKT